MIKKLETIRINLNMPCDLLNRLDDYAMNMNINRTSAICVLITQALDGQKAVNNLEELLKIYQEEQKKQTIEK